MSDLIVVNENMQAVDIYQPEKVKEVIEAISKEVRSKDFDMEKAKDRASCASLAHKIARSKTFLDGLGKTLTTDWKERAKVVDNQRKEIRDSLDSLKEEVREPLTAFENKEKERVKKCIEVIENVRSYFTQYGHENDSTQIKTAIYGLDSINLSECYGDYLFQANEAVIKSKDYLNALYENAKKVEKEREELELLKKEKEERDRKDREERIAREAAEKAKIEAEALAKQREDQIKKEKLEAEQREIELKRKIEQDKIDAENAKIAAELKAEQDKIDAKRLAEKEKQLAIEKERARVAAEMLETETENNRKAAIEQERIKNEDHILAVHSEAKQELGAFFSNATESEKIEFIKYIDSGESARFLIEY
jgi:hypothetical protein